MSVIFCQPLEERHANPLSGSVLGEPLVLGNAQALATPRVMCDLDPLLRLLPERWGQQLWQHVTDLMEVVLDLGRPPFAWTKGQRVVLSDQPVTQNDLDTVVRGVGQFGSDNRAGLSGQLHRVSAVRNRAGAIIGLTMRVGRHVYGSADMIRDLVDSPHSILFLGEPGAGKTTVIRDVTRILAEHSNVCVVDTSNEIAGDGDIPHACIGAARRLMVPSLDAQSSVMIECIQNHTPQVLVVDEIGRPTEVDAVRTCRNRGVRLIASAHGNLPMLVHNPKLRGLTGGVQQVILGDARAPEQSKGVLRKTKTERAGPPVFDIVVELKSTHLWYVVANTTARAVDRILEGKPYSFEWRRRDAASGRIDRCPVEVRDC